MWTMAGKHQSELGVLAGGSCWHPCETACAVCILIERVFKQTCCCCRYAFGYKQSVTTSDNYLGISGKDPSSASCEHLVLVVQLPLAKSAAGVLIECMHVSFPPVCRCDPPPPPRGVPCVAAQHCQSCCFV